MTGGVACMVVVLMNGEEVLQVLFVSFTKLEILENPYSLGLIIPH